MPVGFEESAHRHFDKLFWQLFRDDDLRARLAVFDKKGLREGGGGEEQKEDKPIHVFKTRIRRVSRMTHGPTRTATTGSESYPKLGGGGVGERPRIAAKP